MEKKRLIKFNNTIYRVLAIHGEEVLLIDCIKRNMPKWWLLNEIGMYNECSEEELLKMANTVLQDIEEVDAEARSTAYQRYTTVASILPFIENDIQRTEAIKRVADDKNLCKQTVRNYLCLYLAFQTVSALVPEQRGTYQKKLTDDEKIFRWAINKYYFTGHKNSLKTCYTYMLKERYCDTEGRLIEGYPSFNQFRYYYSKYKKLQTFYISRNGMKDYQRNHRPLLGDRITEYANHVGVGEIDSTICDIHLVDDAGNYLGRPILTIMTDSYSNGYVYGYSLGFEGGTYSLRNLLLNCISAKSEWCKRFGIVINEDEWNINKKVTVGTVERLLNMPNKRFDYLPKCREEVKAYEESQEEFWARKIVWRYRKLLSEGEEVTYSSLAKALNLRRENFISAFSFLFMFCEKNEEKRIRELGEG